MFGGSQGSDAKPLRYARARWHRRLSRVALLSFLTLLLALASSGGTTTAIAAPSRAELDQRLNELKGELATLSRQLEDLKTRLDMPEGATVLLRRMVIRVEALERSIAELTGRIEELDHAQRETAERLERFATDTRARLAALELGRAPDASSGDDGKAAAMTGTAAAVRAKREPASSADSTGPVTTAAAPPAATVPSASSDRSRASAAVADPKAAYDAAFRLLRQGRFAEAEAAFSDFLVRFPEHPLAANAQYWLGETFYVRKDYAHAAEAFLKGYEEHRDRPKAADSLLKLGMSLGALGKREEACATFDELERGFEDLDPRIRQRLKAERARFTCR